MMLNQTFDKKRADRKFTRVFNKVEIKDNINRHRYMIYKDWSITKWCSCERQKEEQI